MANDFPAVTSLTTYSTVSTAARTARSTAATMLSRITAVSQSTSQLALIPPSTAPEAQPQHDSPTCPFAPPTQLIAADLPHIAVREEVIIWCQQNWPLSVADTKLKRIHQLLNAPNKPEMLGAPELFKALNLLDNRGPSLSQIEYTFHEEYQAADPAIVSWITDHQCHVGSAEFRLLTLLKRQDKPVDITPAKMRAALLAVNVSSAYGRSTINLAFHANKIVLSSEMDAWINQYWPTQLDFSLQDKVHLLRAQPNPPEDFDADTVYIALFYRLGANGPGLTTIRQLFNESEISNNPQQLQLLNNGWQSTSGPISDRLLTLLRQPQMKQWRNTNSLFRAMKILYSYNAPLKYQIRTAVIKATGNVSDALLNWVARHWLSTPERSFDISIKRFDALIRQPGMPQPVTASMLYHALQLVGSNPPVKSHVIAAFNHYMKNKPVILSDSAPHTRMQPAPPLDQQITQAYQLLVKVCGEDILERAAESIPGEPSVSQPHKRNTTAVGLSDTVANKLRKVIPAAEGRAPRTD